MNLPPEILWQIANYLDNRSLVNFCLASKGCKHLMHYELIDRQRYKQIELLWNKYINIFGDNIPFSRKNLSPDENISSTLFNRIVLTGDLEFVKWVLNKYSHLKRYIKSYNYILLKYVVQIGNIDMLKWFINIWPPTTEEINYQNNLIHPHIITSSILSDNPDMIQFVLNKWDFDKNSIHQAYGEILHTCTLHNNLEMLQYLNEKWPLSELNNNSLQYICYYGGIINISIRNNNLEMIKWFNDIWPYTEQFIRVYYGRFLYEITETGNMNILNWFIIRWSPGEDRIQNLYRNDGLLYHLIKSGNVEMLKWFTRRWRPPKEQLLNSLKVAEESGLKEMEQYLITEYPLIFYFKSYKIYLANLYSYSKFSISCIMNRILS